MRIDVLTLFPEYFKVLTELGVTARAHSRGLWSFHAWNPRDYVHDVHRTIDGRPYGGGPGMVMLAPPLVSALEQARASRGDAAKVVLLAPGGRTFDQATAAELSQSAGAVFVCGRYEGIDQRFIDRYVDEQWSVGDFVLSGGEPALVPILDAAIRLIPGALNQGDSHGQDSFQDALGGLLDCPHFTRPETFEDQPVPPVLISGHHERIRQWRRQESLRHTWFNRPDLIKLARSNSALTSSDEAYLSQLVSQPLKPEPRSSPDPDTGPASTPPPISTCGPAPDLG